MSQIVKDMAAHAFFKGLGSGHLEQLAGRASEVNYKAGDVIFKEGETADRLYLIREGKVAIELHLPNRNPLTIQTIEKGGVVGWSWLFPPYKWHFQARAMEPTSTITVESKGLLDLCEKDQTLGYQMMKKASLLLLDRLEGTTQQLVDSFDIP